MGYLKKAVESTLVYAEQAKLNDYVSAFRKSCKPADSVVGTVESVLSTHGAPLVDKIDVTLDPLVAASIDKYGQAKKKSSEVYEYAQSTKEGVVSYAIEKKDGAINKVKETKNTATALTSDIISKVKSGEMEQTLLKKAECNAKLSWVATTLVTGKGKLLVNAKTLYKQIETTADKQLVAFKAYAQQLKGKLPIAEVSEKVSKFATTIKEKSSPYVDIAKPYIKTAKAEFNKVYTKLLEFKASFLAKKTA